MLTHDASLKAVTTLLKPESRCAMLFALAAAVFGAESCIETTLELTNRVYDRYFPVDAHRN
jgi:hypothetical protein